MDCIGEDGHEDTNVLQTCIALRTMLVKDGIAYLQAGGGELKRERKCVVD